ncbi:MULTISPECIES: energy-coupling factor transporter transmembrane component T [Bacillota]|uniref:energy-coupling factor transporter transmembrane component T n=1 Tax=Bacillota TaxID=1239 RepID=UPI0008A53CF8|nr:MULTISPECIES: energy-coupling factor transporter transmembrane component T [Bacillota]OFJ68113.1 cobalt transporter [Anaerococcus sp. HMSC065G05]OFR64384.1 cobalt transporter [Streptococcus sp. HMSC073A12]
MSDRKNIDPRIKLTLLPIVGFTSFFISDTILLFVLIVFAFFLYLYSGMWKRALRFILFFVLLYGIELGISKFSEASIVFAIYMFIYFASRMTLIAMFGGYITKTTSVSEMLEALNRMKVPRSIGIPFSVLLRFVPTIKTELKALKENMKIRGIVTSRFFPLLHPIKYIEYTLVPLLMRMIKISDELSASALIRGLDSDENRVTLTELHFKCADLTIGLLGAFMIALMIVIQRIY